MSKEILIMNAHKRVWNYVTRSCDNNCVHNKVESYITENCDKKLTIALKTLLHDFVIRIAPGGLDSTRKKDAEIMHLNYELINFMMKSPSPIQNAHWGFIYIAVGNYDGGNGDMEVHTAHIILQFQV